MNKCWAKIMLLTALMALLLVLPTAASAATSGTCGENLTWTLDDEGLLTISGTGEMLDYSDIGPWGRSIKEVVIESGVTSIGDYAFYSCTSLVGVSLPEGLASIGSYTFGKCIGLSHIQLPESLSSFDTYAFCGCVWLTEISLPSGITSIPRGAFALCAKLVSVSLPDNLHTIGAGAFFSCIGLPSISLPNGLYIIGSQAFENCTRLAKVSLPNTLYAVGPSAFYDCPALTTIAFISNISFIGDSAFHSCSNLTKVAFLSKAMPTLGTNVFTSDPTIYCREYSDVHYWAIDNNYSVEYLTRAKRSILPANLTSIDAEALSSTAAQCYVLPDGAQSIGSLAFASSPNLVRVEIPASVTDIAPDAFNGCEGLTIVAPEGSTAHSFALTEGFNWRAQ